MYKLEIYNHSGSSILDELINSPHLPRVGELIELDEELDNTHLFLVYEVTHKIVGNKSTPVIWAESFYGNYHIDPKTKKAIESDFSRRQILKNEYWIN